MSITHKQKPVLKIASSFVIYRCGMFKSGHLRETFFKSKRPKTLFKVEKSLVARKLKTVAVKLVPG